MNLELVSADSASFLFLSTRTRHGLVDAETTHRVRHPSVIQYMDNGGCLGPFRSDAGGAIGIAIAIGIYVAIAFIYRRFRLLHLYLCDVIS